MSVSYSGSTGYTVRNEPIPRNIEIMFCAVLHWALECCTVRASRDTFCLMRLRMNFCQKSNSWCPSNPLLQCTLTEAAQTGIQSSLPPGDLCTISFRKFLTIPGAKDWLNCMPIPEFHSWIPPGEFCTWLKFYCRIPMYNPSQ